MSILRRYKDPDCPADDAFDGILLFGAVLAAITFCVLWSLASLCPDLAPLCPDLAPDLTQPPPYQGYPD